MNKIKKIFCSLILLMFTITLTAGNKKQAGFKFKTPNHWKKEGTQANHGNWIVNKDPKGRGFVLRLVMKKDGKARIGEGLMLFLSNQFANYFSKFRLRKAKYFKKTKRTPKRMTIKGKGRFTNGDKAKIRAVIVKKKKKVFIMIAVIKTKKYKALKNVLKKCLNSVH